MAAAEHVSGLHLRGLRKLRDALGGRFVAGVVFNLGTRSYTYEDRLHVLPVDRLWTTIHQDDQAAAAPDGLLENRQTEQS